jgi:sulfatase maturation enzyme AslB (radical SAM superfamily)
MANVLITNQCNRTCSYCFAKKEINQSRQKSRDRKMQAHMCLEDFDRVIEFFRRSEMKIMRILGGEPTLHPHFPQVVDKAINAGFDVLLFTGGLVSSRVCGYLKKIDPKRLTLIVNVSCTNDTSKPGEFERVTRTVQRLAEFSMLGYTIYDLNIDSSFLIDLVLETRCRPCIRLGVGVPVVDDDHPLIHPDQYKTMAQHILGLAEQCDRHDITLEFDCGFPLCMFEPGELGYLRIWNCNANFLCSPVVDIGPNLDVWPCFPVSKLYKTRLEKFATRQELVDHFLEKTKAYRTFGMYDQCHICKYKRRGQCAGGCMSHTIRSFD